MANYERNQPTNAKIILVDEKFYLVDGEGTQIELHQYERDPEALLLPENEANRRYFNIKRAMKAIDEHGECVLTYKPTITIGSAPKKDPCEWAYKWLSEEKAAELKAIMDEARAAMEASKPAKQTKAEKLAARIAKLQEELAGLKANQSE